MRTGCEKRVHSSLGRRALTLTGYCVLRCEQDCGFSCSWPVAAMAEGAHRSHSFARCHRVLLQLWSGPGVLWPEAVMALLRRLSGPRTVYLALESLGFPLPARPCSQARLGISHARTRVSRAGAS